MAATVDAWESDWVELRKNERNRWLRFFGLVAVMIIAHALGLPEPIALLLIAPILVWSVIAGWRTVQFSCPRCGREFFRKRNWLSLPRTDAYRGTCIHCGLQKYTPSYKAKPFNKITDNWDRLF